MTNSFATLVKDAEKFQLLEVTKDGMAYLLLLKANEAARAVSRFQESGVISLQQGTVLWQGEGSLPQDLDEILTGVGLPRKTAASN